MDDTTSTWQVGCATFCGGSDGGRNMQVSITCYIWLQCVSPLFSVCSRRSPIRSDSSGSTSRPTGHYTTAPHRRHRKGRYKPLYRQIIGRYKVIPTPAIGCFKWRRYKVIPTNNTIPTDGWMLSRFIPTHAHMPCNSLYRPIVWH